MLKDVRLRVVATDSVHPHEVADQARERRISRRLREDGILRDPLLVGSVPDTNGYILLDGTNRKRALEALNLSGILVQIIEYADTGAVDLRTWGHAALLSLDEIVARLEANAYMDVSQLSPLAAPEVLASNTTLAVLLERGKRCAVTRRSDATLSRPQLLRQLVDIYEDRMVRVDCDRNNVEEQAHNLQGLHGEAATLVAFPSFTRAQVVALAMEAELIPAGITRHVILEGRALRVNLPLPILQMRDGQAAANESLQAHLATLHPRVYSEPTILFDS